MNFRLIVTFEFCMERIATDFITCDSHFQEILLCGGVKQSKECVTHSGLKASKSYRQHLPVFQLVLDLLVIPRFICGFFC